MNSEEIKKFIRKHSALFWYIPEDKKEDLSPDVVVEFIFNYGTLEDIKDLIRILGIEETARIFFSAEGRRKLNYFPEIYNFFSLYFKKYA
ncbi:MAG: hypothetical protein GYA43_02760 [Bacteroidales bacterium]|nr:hypothetical protein [Bacteroidales bacterium]